MVSRFELTELRVVEDSMLPTREVGDCSVGECLHAAEYTSGVRQPCFGVAECRYIRHL